MLAPIQCCSTADPLLVIYTEGVRDAPAPCGHLSHNGDPALVRHFSNAILREDHRGSRSTKTNKTSSRKIDCAVASLIAHHRAAVWREVEAPAEPQLLVL